MNRKELATQMKKNQTLLPALIIAWAILLGGLIRLYAAWKSGFPMVDGGMFLAMTRDLQASHYLLPLFTSYNSIQIPYAYPPLGFYLLAGTNDLFHFDLLSLLTWLPAIISTLTIPAFALLAHRVLGTGTRTALATLIYALTPQAFEWQLMGGGFTRALGAMFALLFIYFFTRLVLEKKFKLLAGTILTGTLTIYSHPEWALQAAMAGLLVWAFFGRNKAGTFRALITAIGIITLSAPWWAVVIARHGLGTFLVAAQTPQGHLFFWWPLLTMDFGGSTNILVVGLGLIALFICIKNRKLFLPVWLVACFLVDMRSASHIIPIQLALLATITLSEVIFPCFMGRPASSGSEKPPEIEALSHRLGQAFFGYLFVAMLINSFTSVVNLADLNVLQLQDRLAMDWVRVHTPPFSRFIAIGWKDSPWVSPLTEWFPALSERNSITTVQGREWLPRDENVTPRIAIFEEIQSCQYQTISCLEDWSVSHGEAYDYVYLSLYDPRDPPGSIRLSSLDLSLNASQNYELVYNGSTVKIYRRMF